MSGGKDDAKAGHRRVEVLTGPGRGRRWPAEETRTVAVAMARSATVSGVVRRQPLSSQQAFERRREACAGLLARPAGEPAAGPPLPDLVPILAEPPAAPITA